MLLIYFPHEVTQIIATVIMEFCTGLIFLLSFTLYSQVSLILNHRLTTVVNILILCATLVNLFSVQSNANIETCNNNVYFLALDQYSFYGSYFTVRFTLILNCRTETRFHYNIFKNNDFVETHQEYYNFHFQLQGLLICSSLAHLYCNYIKILTYRKSLILLYYR